MQAATDAENKLSMTLSQGWAHGSFQEYQDKTVFKVLPMNSNSAVMLSRDRCISVNCDILYSLGLVRLQSPSNWQSHG